MADNRLYILDPATGNKMLLAKSHGGWYIWDAKSIEKRFDELIEKCNDEGREFGICGNFTTLKLATEYEIVETSTLEEMQEDVHGFCLKCDREKQHDKVFVCHDCFMGALNGEKS